MAWSFIATRGSFANKAAATTIPFTVSLAVPIDRILVVVAGCDNIGTTDGDLGDITSVTDARSNTYTKMAQFTNGQGNAAAGATVAVYAARITNALVSGDVVTVNMASSSGGRCALGVEYSVVAGSTPGVQASSTQALDPGTAIAPAVSGQPSQEYLCIGAAAVEGPSSDTYTGDADYGSPDVQSAGSSAGAAPSNITTKYEGRIATLTGDTYNGTLGTARDAAAVLVFIKEIGGGTVITPPTAALVTAAQVAVLAEAVIPPVVALATTTFVTVLAEATIPGIVALVKTDFVATILITANVTIIPPTLALITAPQVPILAEAVIPGQSALLTVLFIPAINVGATIIPPTASLLTTQFAPVLAQSIIPGQASLLTTLLAPVLAQAVIPGTQNLLTALFVPAINVGLSIIPPTVALVTTQFGPVIAVAVIPPTIALVTTQFSPVLAQAIIPDTASLLTALFGPVLKVGIIPGTATLSSTLFGPTLGFGIIPPTTAAALGLFAPLIINSGSVGVVVIPGVGILTTAYFIPTLYIFQRGKLVVTQTQQGSITITQAALAPPQQGSVVVTQTQRGSILVEQL